ncbi:dihydrodipicolinate synthase, partial [Colletotrichum asianum]
RDRRRVCDLVEVLDDLIVVKEGAVVAGRQRERVGGAAFVGVFAELEGLAGRLGAAAGDERDLDVVAFLVDGVGGAADHEAALLACEVGGFAVGAVDYDTCHAGVDKPDEVTLEGVGVDLLSVSKERHGWHVDAVGKPGAQRLGRPADTSLGDPAFMVEKSV